MRAKRVGICLGRRKQAVTLYFLAVLTVLVVTKLWWLVTISTEALMLPPPPKHDLHHLKSNRNLKHYLDHIQLLIQPSYTACEGLEEVPLVVLVASAPGNLEQRGAIRHTWGKHLPTFFVLGLDPGDRNEQLVYSYIEAKEFGDMVVYDFLENYQNLTLKTALMLHWSLRRCPLAGAVLKTDDDVLVNPWVMKDVLQQHQNHQLIGYRFNSSRVHRDEYTKWYIPRWLYPPDIIPEYLSGPSYIIQGDYIPRILETAKKIPLINLEDVYITHDVAKNALGFTLSHDSRLSPYKPWIRTACALWSLAASHSLSADQIMDGWEKLSTLAKDAKRGEKVCSVYNVFSANIFLH